MEYSSTKKQRLPGISFLVDNHSDDDDSSNDDNGSNDYYCNIPEGNSINHHHPHDVTMTSTTNYRFDPVQSPQYEDVNVAAEGGGDVTMESPINAMASYTTTNSTHFNNNTTAAAEVEAPPPSQLFSPTSATRNHSLLQHAEQLVHQTSDTTLERVENGVLDMMNSIGMAFSSVKKRTLGEVECIANEEEGGGELTGVLDVAEAYRRRMESDGLYNDNDDDDGSNDYSYHDGLDDTNDANETTEQVNQSDYDNDVANAMLPPSPAAAAIVEKEEEDVNSIHSNNNNNGSSSIHEEESKRTTSYQDSCYHEDSNNTYNNEEDDDLENDSYYIGNTAGFCSSESVHDSSISETASEEDGDDFYEEEDTTMEEKSCSLDLTGIEKIMNLDDTLPSVIPNMHLEEQLSNYLEEDELSDSNDLVGRSNSDVDLSEIDGVMDLDGSLLPMDSDRGEEDGANDENGNLSDGVLVQDSIHANGKDGDDIVSSLNSVHSTKTDNNTVPQNVTDKVVHPENEEEDDEDDDFVPSAIKQMISQQESHLTSLLGSISNMQSTPGRIKKLEASLMGDEDEDTGLNEMVDMPNIEIGLTPVKRRLELVAEEEPEVVSARIKLNGSCESGLEPELQVEEEQEKVIAVTSSPCECPQSEAEDKATTSSPSLELEVDREEDNCLSSPPAAEPSVEVPASSSPWLSFITRQSSPSQTQDAAATPPSVPETVAEPEIQDSEELPPSILSSQLAEEMGMSPEVTPTELSESVADKSEVPDAIPQLLPCTDNIAHDVMETSGHCEMNTCPEGKKELELTDNHDDQGEEVQLAAIAGESSPQLPTCDESEQLSESCLEEVPVADMENCANSEAVIYQEPSNHSTSPEAFGSVVKATGTSSDAEPEPTLTSEEPTLECLRGAFLAAESKLEAESKVPAPAAAESHDANEGELTDSFSDNKSESSSVVNDTFETANFSLGDIEKAVNENSFFDAEDDINGVDDVTVKDAFEPCEHVQSAGESSANNDILECGDELGKVANPPTNCSLENQSLAESQPYVAPEDSQSVRLSPSASDESVLNESMFMPNASMEVASPPLVDEGNLALHVADKPSNVVDTHESTPEDEYESEDGDNDEDFFPNRDLRSSTNVPKESTVVNTTSKVEDSSQPGSISSGKLKTKNSKAVSEKELPSRLSNVANRVQPGSSSLTSSNHRNRLSAAARAPKTALASNSRHSSTNAEEGNDQRVRDSASQKRPPRARVRSKKVAIPIDGKENNKAERTSTDTSFESKTSTYSSKRLEQLAKPRRHSVAPKSSSPVKQRDSNKVASIGRLSRLAQPKRRSTAPTVPTNKPVQKKATQKASIERLSRLAQPKRQSVAPAISPVKKKEHQKVAAGTPSFVRRSKLMSSSKPMAKSTEELEQDEMSQVKPFKAKPLNGREVPSRFKAYDSKPPRNTAAPPAPPPKLRPPAAVKAPSSRLYQPSPRRHKVLTFGETQQSYLNNGLRSAPPLPTSSPKLTTPKPFALSADSKISSKPPPASSDEIELQKKFKAKPYPFARRHTMSFNQAKSSEELELEECRKQFKALPLPSSVSTTPINYSNTPYHIKAQQQHQMAMERKQRIADESQETIGFKARPVPRTTYEARQVLRQSTSGITRPVASRPPRLSLASRAEQRKLFDEHARELREKDAEVKESILRQQQEWEEEELRQKRMTSAEEGGMCFKARQIQIEYM